MQAKPPETVESDYVLDTKLTTLVPLLQQGQNGNAVWRMNGPVGGGDWKICGVGERKC